MRYMALLLMSLFTVCACERDSVQQSSAPAEQPQSIPETVAAPGEEGLNPENMPEEAVQNNAENTAESDNIAEAVDSAESDNTAGAENSAQAAAGSAPESADADIHSFDPLSESQRAIVQNITWDLPPEVLNAVLKENEGGHFLFSDEKHPEMFRPTIENLGGTYMGIGTDQGYVFIGWQRPTLAFLVDYDPWVVVIHRIYMALFKACENGDCMLGYFEDPEKGREFLASVPELSNRETLSIYKDAQRGITNRLRNIRRMKEKTFMNDAETYQYIKNLIEAGRLTTFQANLLGDRAFASTREAMQKLGAQMTVLYLSNAEQYWRYSDQYRKNMSELDYSDNAMILRTIATKPVNGDYRYSAQKADLFKAWIVLPTTHTYKDFVAYTRNKDPEVFPFTLETKEPTAESGESQ